MIINNFLRFLLFLSSCIVVNHYASMPENLSTSCKDLYEPFDRTWVYDTIMHSFVGVLKSIYPMKKTHQVLMSNQKWISGCYVLSYLIRHPAHCSDNPSFDFCNDLLLIELSKNLRCVTCKRVWNLEASNRAKISEQELKKELKS